MSSSSSAKRIALARSLLRNSRLVSFPFHATFASKKIRYVTVSRYRSWNSGESFRNSSPGWLANSSRSTGRKSECSRYCVVTRDAAAASASTTRSPRST